MNHPDLYCEHCGTGPECGICGRGIGQALRPVWTRWLVRRDSPGVLAVDRETGGTWTDRDLVRIYRPSNVIGAVADDGYRIRGFFLARLDRDAARLTVLNFAALDPVARAALLAQVRAKAEQYRRIVFWASE